MMERLEGGVGRGGFLDQTEDFDRVAGDFADVEDAVTVGVLGRHFADGKPRCRRSGGRRPASCCRQGVFAEHKIVWEQNGERVVADEGTRAPDGVAEAERGPAGGRWRWSRAASPLRAGVSRASRLPRSASVRLKLEGNVEMVDQRGLAAAGGPCRTARCRRRAPRQPRTESGVYQPQAAFPLAWPWSAGRKPCAEPGDRKDSFAQWF